MGRTINPVLLGGGLIVFASLTAAAGDGVTKFLGQRAAAGQVLFWLGALIVGMAFALRFGTKRPLLSGGFITIFPGLMALRSTLGVLSTACFFKAFATLQLAEVFLFLGLMPVMAAIMGQFWLQETITPAAWLALGIGTLGMTFLFPGGFVMLNWGHSMAALGALAGTGSLVILRRMSVEESNPFAHLVYPHLALAVFFWPVTQHLVPTIEAPEIGLIVVLAILVLTTRALVIFAFERIPAHVATLLMNLQFVWMTAIGIKVFAEVPKPAVLLGAVFVMASGAILVAQQVQLPRKAPPKPSATPAE